VALFICTDMNEELENLKKKISEVKVTATRESEDGNARRIYNYCIHLLARQDYSEYKLRQKLRSKPQNLPHMIDDVLIKLKEKGLLREEAYRRLFIRKWMMKGESEDKIRKRGAQEKLTFDSEEFRSIEIELGFTDEDSIEKLILKKLRSKEIPQDRMELMKLKDKVLRFLISKGHDYGDAKSSLDKFIKNSKNPESYL
jgi:SOS response regulatory protein OraA/RecX